MKANAAQLTRRNFVGLTAGAAALGAAALIGCSSSGSTRSADTEEAADTVETLEPTSTKDADVVVVGSGASGLCAAVEAAEQGATVVMLEKNNMRGGSTQFAEGVFGIGSKMQKEMGIDADRNYLLLQEYLFQNYKVNPKLMERLFDNSADNINWLQDHGVEFATVAATGGEWATWHVYAGDSYGMAIVDPMGAAADDAGVETLLSTAAKSVVMEDGKVAGVIAESDDGEVIQVNAPAVILATGGFGASPDKVKEYCRYDYDRLNFRGVPTDTGDGIDMAMAAGGISQGEYTVCAIGSTVAGLALDSHAMLAGSMEPMDVWVNQDVERFINEEITTHYTRATNSVMMQEAVYSFIDSTVLERLRDEGARYGAGAYVVPGTKLENVFQDLDDAIDAGNTNVVKGGTIEEVAEGLGIDASKAAGVIADYNAMCEAGEDTDYQKAADNLVALTKAPFYGFKVTCNMMNTMGGIKINRECQVLGEGNEPIVGLYAAGMDCDGYAGETYGISLPGTDQAIAVCTGRIAGNNAAQL